MLVRQYVIWSFTIHCRTMGDSFEWFIRLAALDFNERQPDMISRDKIQLRRRLPALIQAVTDRSSRRVQSLLA